MRIYLLLFIVLITSCGGPRALEEGAGVLKIEIDERRAAEQAAVDLMKSFTHGDFGLFAAPTAVADFECFAANVTGSGIVPNSNIEGCTTSSNFGGRGVGALSEIQPRGTPLQVVVSSGAARQIEIWGMNPRPKECGGSSGSFDVYALGRKTVDIFDDATVSIPIALSTTSIATCTSQGGGPLALSASSVYTTTSAGNCPVAAAAAGSSATGGVPALTTNIGSEDGVGTFEKCYGVTGQVATLDYYFGALGIGTPTTITVYWRGRAGAYSTGAYTSQTFNGGAGGQLYINTGGSTWQPVGTASIVTTGATYESITATVAFNPATMIQGGSSIIVRMAGGTFTAYDSVVDTDYISITLQ